MKTLIAFTLVGFSSLSAASNLITDFTVYSKSNIEYARSDFEGLVGAGGDIVVEDFSFMSATNSGVVAAGTLKQSRGFISSVPVVTGKTIQFSTLKATGALNSCEVYLDYTQVSGDIRANYLKVTTAGYMNYETSSYGAWKKISRGVCASREATLTNDMASLGIDLDNLSVKCNELKGDVAEVAYGRLILKGDKAQNVFNVDGTFMGSVRQIIFQMPANSSAIINVSGSSVVFENLGVKLNGADPKKIIWNIFEATSLQIRHAGGSENVNGRSVGMPGTFMAPQAETTFNEALITGSLWVKKLDGNEPGLNGGQVNDSLFNGISCIPVRTGGKH